MKNIILIGFMGTGKTTIATKLAIRLNMRYVSTDNIIEKREKRTINEIFTDSGQLQAEYQVLPLLADSLARKLVHTVLDRW